MPGGITDPIRDHQYTHANTKSDTRQAQGLIYQSSESGPKEGDEDGIHDIQSKARLAKGSQAPDDDPKATRKGVETRCSE